MFMFIFIYIFILTYCLFFLGDWNVVHSSLIVPPFQKVCGNCHVVDVTISSVGGVYCKACCSKSTIQKIGFFCGFIATNDERMLLTIEGK